MSRVFCIDDHFSKFVSRLGEAWRVPDWFVKNLPTEMTLDGEIWGGYSSLDSTLSLVKSKEFHSPHLWQSIRFKGKISDSFLT